MINMKFCEKFVKFYSKSLYFWGTFPLFPNIVIIICAFRLRFLMEKHKIYRWKSCFHQVYKPYIYIYFIIYKTVFTTR